MRLGTVILSNDLLGHVVGIVGERLEVRSGDGRIHTVKARGIHEVASPRDVARLTAQKLFGGKV